MPLPQPETAQDISCSILYRLFAFVAFGLAILLFVSGLGLGWSTVDPMDVFFSTVSLLLVLPVLVCGTTMASRSASPRARKISAAIVIIALIYGLISEVIYSPSFWESWNDFAVSRLDQRLCIVEKIGCLNQIAINRGDSTLCYGGGLGTSECMSQIAVDQRNSQTCLAGNFAEGYKNTCLTMYAQRMGDSSACNLITHKDPNRVSDLKNDCRQAARAWSTNKVTDCPKGFNSCIQDLAVKLKDPSLCTNYTPVSDTTGKTDESTKSLDAKNAQECQRLAQARLDSGE